MPALRRLAALTRIARNEKGAALLAARDIEAGDVVASFAGPVCALEAIPPREMPYAVWLFGNRWLVPRGKARLINHGCDPNCIVDDAPNDPDGLEAVALRAIRAGEEITFDYNGVEAEEWRRNGDDPFYRFWHPSWTFRCRCGAADCQGWVAGYRIIG
jgi:hypothetical protein